MDPVTHTEPDLEETVVEETDGVTVSDPVLPEELLADEVDDSPGEPSMAPDANLRHTASQILEHVQVDTTNPANVMIIIGAVIVLGVGATWWYLTEDEEIPAGTRVTVQAPSARSFNQLPAVVRPESSEPEAPATGIDAILERARMAANAGLLIEPRGVSALDYYLAVLEEDPGHGEAGERVTSILAAVLGDAEAAVRNGRPENAVSTIAWLKGIQPSNPGIAVIEDMLRDQQADRIQQATRLIGQGEFATAEAQLDGLSLESYSDVGAIDAARAQLASARETARQQARTDARRQQQLARQKQISGIIADIRSSVADGRLVSPADNSAEFHIGRLKNVDPDNPEIGTGYAATVAGLIVRANTEAAQSNYEAAENWLVVAEKFGIGTEKINDTRQGIAQRQVDEQAQRVVPATQLILVRYVPPEYPSLAIRREVEGWVNLVFTVTTSGETADIEITSGEKQNYFEKSAISAVEQWLFEPKTFNGQPVNQRVSFRLDYTLNN